MYICFLVYLSFFIWWRGGMFYICCWSSFSIYVVEVLFFLCCSSAFSIYVFKCCRTLTVRPAFVNNHHISVESGSNYVVEVLQLVDCDAYLLFGTAILLYLVAWSKVLSMLLICFPDLSCWSAFQIYVLKCCIKLAVRPDFLKNDPCCMDSGSNYVV